MYKHNFTIFGLIAFWLWCFFSGSFVDNGVEGVVEAIVLVIFNLTVGYWVFYKIDKFIQNWGNEDVP